MDHQIFEVHIKKKTDGPKTKKFLAFSRPFPGFFPVSRVGWFFCFFEKKCFFFGFLVWDILHRPHPHSMVPYTNGSGTISAEP